ncbi:uncharacterized protein LOC128204577 [Mya arenaria]|uniref:uncharacterized protein LOC128204577 n=1 Tax=Mya arenaria TaxID=6604 RepID=UPI0022E22069|nr:uncharacterized protein LOC128204577 [Mya arenaria]
MSAGAKLERDEGLKHFIDCRPTKQNAIPVLEMGYRPVTPKTPGRRPLKRRSGIASWTSLVPFDTETSEAVHSQTKTSETVEGPDPIETETSKSVVDPDPIETVAVDSQTETTVETDPATSSRADSCVTVRPFETETSEAVHSQTETSEAVEGPDPIETETSKSVVDPDPIETVAVDSQTKTTDETDPATSSGLVFFETETSEAVHSQTETSEAVEGPDPIETETSKSVVDPDPIETVAVDSQTETSVETDPATSSGLVPFETETSEAVHSQTETSEAVEGPDPIETETSKSVVDLEVGGKITYLYFKVI